MPQENTFGTNSNTNYGSRFSRPQESYSNNNERRHLNRRQNRYYKNNDRKRSNYNYNYNNYYENDSYDSHYHNNYRRSNYHYNDYEENKNYKNRRYYNKKRSKHYYDNYNSNDHYDIKNQSNQSIRPQLREFTDNNNDNNDNNDNNGSDDYEKINFDVINTLHIPDRSKEMLKELLEEKYECLICTSSIGIETKIWNCGTCKAIFHLECINNWAVKLEEEEAKSQDREVKNYNLINKVKCPMCNKYDENFEYNTYYCYCKKLRNPKYDSFVGIPHSCGEICGKKRHKSCPHTCNMICHPGSCMKCNITDLKNVSYCGCGKMKYTLKCGETEVEKKICGQICGKLLNCNNHYCKEFCHRGPCLPCDIKNNLSCFCGKVKKSIDCGNDINGSFNCKQICNEKLKCGNHTCTLTCHQGSHVSCKRKVSSENICACGKTKLLNSKKRNSCLDPLPTCTKTCNKPLNCKRHFCKNKCHDSKCPPCNKIIKKQCRCGERTMSITCGEYYSKLRIYNKNLNNNINSELPLSFDDTIFICKKKCKRIKSCGVHKCDTYCCKGKHKKVFDGHVCRIRCMKPLNCGIHVCTNYCHIGKCDPCRTTYRNGLSCTCGYTKIQGPVQCGKVKLPTCPQPCSKQLNCGHFCTSRCHFGDCQKCLVKVNKRCSTHNKLVLNVHCYRKNVSCGKLCGKVLKCGHKCLQSCGHLNDCNQIRNGCQAVCNKKLKCGHKCAKKCTDHYDKSCYCNKQITVSCICGGRKESYICKMKLKKDIYPPSCNDTCRIAQQNKLFGQAFNISGSKKNKRKKKRN